MKKLTKLLSTTLALTLVLTSTATAAAPAAKEEAVEERPAIVAVAEEKAATVEEIIAAAEEKAAAPAAAVAAEEKEEAEAEAEAVEVALVEYVAEAKGSDEVPAQPEESAEDVEHVYSDEFVTVEFCRDNQELRITGEGKLPEDFWKYLVSVEKMDALLERELEAYYGVDVIRVSADTDDPFEFLATNEYVDAVTGETLYVTEDMIGAIDFSEALRISPERVVISEGIENIPTFAFAFCTELEEIVLPSTIESIGEGAFAYCTGLKNIVLPASVASIYLGSFDGCVNLETIQITAYDNAAEAQFYGTNANVVTGMADDAEVHHCEFIA